MLLVCVQLQTRAVHKRELSVVRCASHGGHILYSVILSFLFVAFLVQQLTAPGTPERGVSAGQRTTGFCPEHHSSRSASSEYMPERQAKFVAAEASSTGPDHGVLKPVAFWNNVAAHTAVANELAACTLEARLAPQAASTHPSTALKQGVNMAIREARVLRNEVQALPSKIRSRAGSTTQTDTVAPEAIAASLNSPYKGAAGLHRGMVKRRLQPDFDDITNKMAVECREAMKEIHVTDAEHALTHMKSIVQALGGDAEVMKEVERVQAAVCHMTEERDERLMAAFAKSMSLTAELSDVTSDLNAAKTELVTAYTEAEEHRANITELQKELKSSKGWKSTFKSLTGNQTTVSALALALSQSKAQIADMVVRLKDTQGSVMTLTSALSLAHVKLHNTEERLDTAHASLEAVGPATDTLKSEIREAQLKLAGTEAELATAKVELFDANVKVEQVTSESSTAGTELEDTTAELEDTKAELAGASTKLAQLASTNSQLASEAEATRVKLAKSEAAAAKMTSLYDACSSKLVDAEGSLDQLLHDSEETSAELATLKTNSTSAATELRANVDTASSTLAHRLSELQELQLQHAALRTEATALDSTNAWLKEQACVCEVAFLEKEGALRKEHKAAQEEASIAQQQRATAQTEVVIFRQQLERAQQQIADTSSELGAAKATMSVQDLQLATAAATHEILAREKQSVAEANDSFARQLAELATVLEQTKVNGGKRADQTMAKMSTLEQQHRDTLHDNESLRSRLSTVEAQHEAAKAALEEARVLFKLAHGCSGSVVLFLQRGFISISVRTLPARFAS